MVSLNPQALAKLDKSPAQAFPLVIAEVTGFRRSIVLRGRSLPYRDPGFAAPSKLRINVKYFPGNPVGQTQVLGPEWGQTTLRGVWKDSFLFDTDSKASLYGFPPIAGPGRPGSVMFGGKSFASGGAVPGSLGEAKRARTLRDAVYMLQRSGQLLKVEWGSIVRYGFLEEFVPTHIREEDIAWEMSFRWTGDTASLPKFLPKAKLDPLGLLAKILAAIQGFLDAVNAALAVLFGAVKLIQQRILNIASLISGLINTISAIASLATVPAQLFGTLKQGLAMIKNAIRDLISTIRRIPAAYSAAKESGNVLDVNIAAGVAQAIARNALQLGVLVDDTAAEVDAAVTSDVIATVTLSQGQTLRDVARTVYPDNVTNGWVLIAEFNDLTTSTPPAGTVVRVPRPDYQTSGG